MDHGAGHPSSRANYWLSSLKTCGGGSEAAFTASQLQRSRSIRPVGEHGVATPSRSRNLGELGFQGEQRRTQSRASGPFGSVAPSHEAARDFPKSDVAHCFEFVVVEASVRTVRSDRSLFYVTSNSSNIAHEVC